MKKDLLKLLDLSQKDIARILNLADQLKFNKRHGLLHEYLKGKTLAMIFQKSSTRTRVSFEAGMYQLGGHALYLNANDLQMGRGEPIEDTARALSRYCDCIMIRTYAQEEVETLAKYSSVPVINGLTDFAHPCQVLADLMTIREKMTRLHGLKMCYIGDGNNMANSLIVGALKCDMSISVACPKEYTPDPVVLEFAKQYGGKFTLTESINEAAKGADVMVTDVWASMGMEKDAEARRQAFSGYRIDENLMKLASPKAMVLHCLPAHRGEEITADVFEAHADEIFEEAENRMHVQKAVLTLLVVGDDIESIFYNNPTTL